MRIMPVCFHSIILLFFYSFFWTFVFSGMTLLFSVFLVTQVTKCPSLVTPMDCSPSGSSVYEISQARILEWIAISFSRGSSWPRNWTQVSCIVGRFFTDWSMRESQVILDCSIFFHVFRIYFSKFISLRNNNY